MTWPASLSTFVLNRVCQSIKKGILMDRGFKVKDLEAIGEDVFRFYGRRIESAQIYNHLRHWRPRWVRVLKTERLEEVR